MFLWSILIKQIQVVLIRKIIYLLMMWKFTVWAVTKKRHYSINHWLIDKNVFRLIIYHLNRDGASAEWQPISSIPIRHCTHSGANGLSQKMKTHRHNQNTHPEWDSCSPSCLQAGNFRVSQLGAKPVKRSSWSSCKRLPTALTTDLVKIKRGKKMTKGR